MVDPSPPIIPELMPAVEAKALLRQHFRKARKYHVAALPPGIRALILSRPPAPLVDFIKPNATVGLYYPTTGEAPTLGWARWLSENGRKVALPWFADRDSAMEFRLWENPWNEAELSTGPWRTLQPKSDHNTAAVVPDIVVAPLVAFTATGQRLGQGGGHYDRWLSAHPDVKMIGLAWDCQQADTLPSEAHDRPLNAIVTPTRFYEIEL